jgi:hypothetical protein
MTELQISGFSLYEELKMRRVNLDWYEKRKQPKASGQIPLEDKRCSRLSIYLLKRDGSLWSVKSDGEAYNQVRKPSKPIAGDIYVCMSCEHQWQVMPAEHREGGI